MSFLEYWRECKEGCGRFLSPSEKDICATCWERKKKELSDFGEDNYIGDA